MLIIAGVIGIFVGIMLGELFPKKDILALCERCKDAYESEISTLEHKIIDLENRVTELEDEIGINEYRKEEADRLDNEAIEGESDDD